MTTTEPTPRQGALDWLFSRLAAGRAPSAAPRLDEIDDPETPAATPEVRSPEDVRRAADWLARERRRLEAYTRAQLGRVQQEHQALVQQKYLSEQSLIVRSQEVSRQEQLIVARTKELDERGVGGEALAEAMERLQQGRAREEAALAARRAQLDDRFAEADRAALAAEQRLAELDDLEERLSREAERRERELGEWQAQLDEVYRALEQHAREMDRRGGE